LYYDAKVELLHVTCFQSFATSGNSQVSWMAFVIWFRAVWVHLFVVFTQPILVWGSLQPPVFQNNRVFFDFLFASAQAFKQD